MSYDIGTTPNISELTALSGTERFPCFDPVSGMPYYVEGKNLFMSEEVTFQNGDLAEYLGEASRPSSGVVITFYLYNTLTSDVIADKVLLPLYGDATGRCDIKIYSCNTVPIVGQPINGTVVYENTYSAESIPNTYSSMFEIEFPSQITFASGKTVVAAIATTAATMYVRAWTTTASNRHPLAYSNAQFGSVSAFLSTYYLAGLMFKKNTGLEVTQDDLNSALALRDAKIDDIESTLDIVPAHHNLSSLSLTRMRLSRLSFGQTDVFKIAMIGDSWTHTAARYSGKVYQRLQSIYGNAGYGFTSYAAYSTTEWSLKNGNIDSSVAVSYAGSWIFSAYKNGGGPDIGQVSSSIAGDSITISYPETQSTAVLHYAKGSGVVRYKYDSGSWTEIDLTSGTGYGTVALATPPGVGFTLTVEVVSGIPVLYGVLTTLGSVGTMCFKLGSTGSASSNWAPSNFSAGLAKLAPHMVSILLGTNDEYTLSDAVYKSNILSMITAIKGAVPGCDILLISPCENGAENIASQFDYQRACYELSVSEDVAFLNLQSYFGAAYSEYGYGSPKNLFSVDGIHPDPDTGGYLIADTLLRAITQSL